MKGTGFIFMLILISSACTEEIVIEEEVTNDWKLPIGKFFAHSYRHSDTIMLQPHTEYSKISGWTELYWTVSEDSLIQSDARGHTHFMGLVNGTYLISNDTLTISFAAIDNDFGYDDPSRFGRANYKKKDLNEIRTDKYLILQANDSLIEIATIRDTTKIRANPDLRSDIQLR